jgi:DNA-binding NtrC family response regulator
MLIAQVDDDSQALILVRRAMTHQLPEMELVEVRTGAQLRELVASRTPDAILLDFNLPDRDGLGLLRDLRRDGYEGAVVFITGVGSEKVAVEAMKRGATDYLVKTPGYEIHVPRAVQKVLERVRIEKEVAEASASRISDERKAAEGKARADLAAEISDQLREPLHQALEELDAVDRMVALVLANPSALAAEGGELELGIKNLRADLERVEQTLTKLGKG